MLFDGFVGFLNYIMSLWFCVVDVGIFINKVFIEIYVDCLVYIDLCYDEIVIIIFLIYLM